MAKLEVKGSQFLLDGETIRILSGAIHYFRVVPEYWEDRLLKLKACGFNTVETYIPWNLHEPMEGVFNFDGLADVERFIALAGELGLHVIVRPSPYICAEWEFGGLPAWLLSDPDIRLRCLDERYLRKVDAYYDVLIPKLAPLLNTNGGPIIAMQIENEYGSYGNDQDYLLYLKNGLQARGIDVLLFTSDGPTDQMLQGGTLPGVLATVNFGSRPEEEFKKFREYRPEEPLFCMEYWNGWFDHWLKPHHTRDGEDVADVLDRMLAAGASVNFYMFHGGTNFGFYNGANYQDKYEPTVTSYDYDAPLSECGDITAKYKAVREVMRKHGAEVPEELPEPSRKKNYGTVAMKEAASLFANLDTLSVSVRRRCPEPMEKLGQNYGFIVYRTRISGPRKAQELRLQDVHDRAQVFLDGRWIGTVERWAPKPLVVDIPEQGATLEILVENMGRINYGPRLKDAKGITEGVRLDNQFLFDWEIYPLPLADLSALSYAPFQTQSKTAENPMFFRGELLVDDIADTFIRLDGWTKGVVWINGFNIGRYWEQGPQKTLYVPGPLLRQGANEIVVLELHGTDKPDIELIDLPDLG
ncbi:beta-galactosidase [Paenibacillus sp. PAMC21692]|uniref:glycoside hydrolase family 35 protein n=1 Tax=Paenibacillus sp. PAMC21692 TaxID=2762320 RepID=UPI00164DA74D|nr:beta-galactosidase [Paenibacillus sp. PAMC21692]QNK60278.1 beta-galactosidase [Paenibacillus sp. PAMC21692]